MIESSKSISGDASSFVGVQQVGVQGRVGGQTQTAFTVVENPERKKNLDTGEPTTFSQGFSLYNAAEGVVAGVGNIISAGLNSYAEYRRAETKSEME